MGKRVYELRYVLVLPDGVDIAACDCGEQEDLPEIIAHTYWELDGIDGYSITCPTCGDRTAVYTNRIDAIADWNSWKCGAKVVE